MDENHQIIALPHPAIRSQAALDFARAATSENTQRAYRAGWRVFTDRFCVDLGYQPLPATPETVVEFITWSSDQVKVSTIEARLAAISFAHRLAGFPDPTADNDVRLVMMGLRKKKGMPPERQDPLMDQSLQKALTALPRSLRGTRDRALLLIGYACALRRSEIAAMKIDDLRFSEGEMVVALPRRKTDPYGHGTTIVVPKVGGPLCAVTALRRWLRESGIEKGPIFRRIDRWENLGSDRLDGKSIADIIKAAAKSAGLDSLRISGHSLRVGFVTSADEHNVPIGRIREVTGHRSDSIYAYIRDRGRGGRKAIEAVLQPSMSEPSKN